MEPNREGSPINFELPPPDDAERAVEHAAEAPAETTGKRPKQPAMPTIPDDIPAADTPVISALPPAATSADDSHVATQDSDRIERQWVDKAKAVIAKTHDDPYMQKHEMSKVKSEYIRKRFGKQIKTDEAPA